VAPRIRHFIALNETLLFKLMQQWVQRPVPEFVNNVIVTSITNCSTNPIAVHRLLL
jgi:hypothetical protein